MLPERTTHEEERYFNIKYGMYRALVDVALLIIDDIRRERASDADSKKNMALRYTSTIDSQDGRPYLQNIQDHVSDRDLDDPTQLTLGSTMQVHGIEYVASLSIQWRDDHVIPREIYFELADTEYILVESGFHIDCGFEIHDVLTFHPHDMQGVAVEVYSIDPRKESLIIRYVAMETLYDHVKSFEEYVEDIKNIHQMLLT